MDKAAAREVKTRKSILLVILITTTGLFIFAPKELMPKEDRGAFFVIVKAPQSSGFEFTSSKAQEIEGFLLPEVGKGEYRRLLLRVLIITIRASWLISWL